MGRGQDGTVLEEEEQLTETDRPAVEVTRRPDANPELRRLELARADVLQRLELSDSDAYRVLLQQTLAAIDEKLASLRS